MCIKFLLGGRREEVTRKNYKDNIKMGLKKIGWKSVNLTDVGQNKDQWWAFVNTVMNLRVS
jgi:hypothetical protein